MLVGGRMGFTQGIDQLSDIQNSEDLYLWLFCQIANPIK